MNPFPYLYSDNSLQKPKIQAKKFNNRSITLSYEYEALASANAERKQIKQLKNQVKERLLKEIKDLKLQNKMMQKAAVKIQRSVKLWLKNKTSSYSVEEISLIAKTNVLELENLTEFIRLNLGNSLIEISIKLQRAYRRYVFYQKIKRIKFTYKVLRNEKMQKAIVQIKKGLIGLGKKLKVQELKFEAQRQEKLKEIRKRLSLVSIKQFLHKEELTPKQLVKRVIKRYRNEDSEVEEQERLSMLAAIQEEISLKMKQNVFIKRSLISHGIKKPHSKDFERVLVQEQRYHINSARDVLRKYSRSSSREINSQPRSQNHQKLSSVKLSPLCNLKTNVTHN